MHSFFEQCSVTVSEFTLLINLAFVFILIILPYRTFDSLYRINLRIRSTLSTFDSVSRLDHIISGQSIQTHVK